MTKRALICGISGQDGAYLAQLLLAKGYEVIGSSRDAELSSFSNLVRLGIKDQIKLVSMAPSDFRSAFQVINDARPSELYNLSGQSSVGLSFQQPVETLDSIANGTLNLLEVIRMLGLPVRFYNAASGECFGDLTPEAPATENTPFRPRSPYGVAKAAAFWAVANYREAYGLYTCSGLLFNHESYLRPQRFVTRKVVHTARRIAAGEDIRLTIGRTSIIRDWGFAPEYVEAMWLMLQQDEPQDFVIATGESHSLEAFVDASFAHLGLDWRDHTDTNPDFYRSADIGASYADPTLAAEKLGWRAKTRLKGLIEELNREPLDAAR